MTERSESRKSDAINEDELAWAAAHLPELRRWLAGDRILYTWLAIGFILGLAAHVTGYLLAAFGGGEPVGLLSDLLANLGVALWTGGVLVFFVQVLPEAKRRSAARRLDAYEAALREQGRLDTLARRDVEAGDER